MSATSVDQDALSSALAAVRDDRLPSGNAWDQSIRLLESFECWTPLFRAVERKLANPNTRALEDYILLAKIEATSLEDKQKSAEYCVKLFQQFNISYEDFCLKVLPEVVGEEDFATEGEILFSIVGRLQNFEEKVSCLERICLIYEKKKYDEDRLNYSYDLLLATDPKNTKALRYFKAVYTQNQRWESVIEVLKTLYKHASHPNDAFRIAQEWASVWLLQLDNPTACLKVLDDYCQDSPLDTSSLYYEAHYRCSNWHGCLDVLKIFYDKVEGSQNKAVVLLKIGEMYELTENIDNAVEAYEKSFACSPRYLEGLENLIEIFCQKKEWARVLDYLTQMKNAVKKSYLIERIDEAISRIEDAISSSKKT